MKAECTAICKGSAHFYETAKERRKRFSGYVTTEFAHSGGRE